MKIKVKLFGIAKDIVASTYYEVLLNEGETVNTLKSKLKIEYPAFADLRSLMIAVNNEYAKDDLMINKGDEVALIPPVSGG